MMVQELIVNYGSAYDNASVEDLKQEIEVLENSIEASQGVIEEVSNGTLVLGELELGALYQELQGIDIKSMPFYHLGI
ncbi:MAG: hypothetical protein K2J20_02530 [Bacilli bacterium]|nr:hypothetical protein [Bacilli bacterium]